MARSYSPNNQVDFCPDSVGFSLFFSFFPWYLPYDKDIGNNSYLPILLGMQKAVKQYLVLQWLIS